MPRIAKIDPLPDTMSGLIRVALKDLKKAERTPRYSIQMDAAFHEPQSNGKVCTICFAGAVMAGTFKASPLQHLKPSDWWNGIENKMEALDRLRDGEVIDAALKLNFSVPKMAKVTAFHQNNDCYIPSYSRSKKKREAFHAAMRKLANGLAKAGL